MLDLQGFKFIIGNKVNGDCMDRLEVEKWLIRYKIEGYTINEDLSVDVTGNVNLSSKDLIDIPVRFRNVSGDFFCGDNRLESLIGCPSSVGGDFSCFWNKLVSLEGCPIKVGGNFFCDNNNITSLDGCPVSIGGVLNCGGNQLTSLAGCPVSVGGNFYCFNNYLTSLVVLSRLLVVCIVIIII